ncbi:hypothetical protein BDY24DRAFT_362697 [Mrakia frigida]|uniref:uncharacterized protein n=1 Tax=Mrakia frigida TaxID=29902 RepID=UPI003FCBF905
MASPLILYGSLVDSISLTHLRYLSNALICINQHGIIDWLVPNVPSSSVASVLSEKGLKGTQVTQLKKGQFLSPGFIDTHTHAPQHPNLGTGGQYQLLDWLENVTFPREARFKDVDYSRKVYERVVKRTLDLGTTTSCYYGSLHLESTKVLADVVHAGGQRGFVGKCNMDSNCPSTYIEPSPSASIADTVSLISHIRSLPASSPTSTPLVQPIITPRFAISCSAPLLQGLGDLVRSEKEAGTEVAVQTHLGENHGEIAFTKEIFAGANERGGMKNGWDGSYAGVYESFGLLGERTILAHCVHLEETELQTIKRTNSGISHCPTSNLNLRSGCAKVGEMLERGIKVGLGTDCSGGYESGILSQIRSASTTSKLISMASPSSAPSSPETPPPEAATSTPRYSTLPQLPLPTLFHLATLGGASLCGLDKVVGNFEVGKEFDALLVDLGEERGNGALWFDEEEGGEEGWLEGGFEQWIWTGDDRNIAKVWVQGRLVGGKDL